MITNVGITKIQEWLTGGSPTEPTTIAIGTGSTTPNMTDTALVGQKFVDTFSAAPDILVSKKVLYELLVETDSANGNIIREYGLFDGTSGAKEMYARSITTPLSKSSSIEIQVEPTIKFIE